jgi:hypothetical protein
MTKPNEDAATRARREEAELRVKVAVAALEEARRCVGRAWEALRVLRRLRAEWVRVGLLEERARSVRKAVLAKAERLRRLGGLWADRAAGRRDGAAD